VGKRFKAWSNESIALYRITHITASGIWDHTVNAPRLNPEGAAKLTTPEELKAELTVETGLPVGK